MQRAQTKYRVRMLPEIIVFQRRAECSELHPYCHFPQVLPRALILFAARELRQSEGVIARSEYTVIQIPEMPCKHDYSRCGAGWQEDNEYEGLVWVWGQNGYAILLSNDFAKQNSPSYPY